MADSLCHSTVEAKGIKKQRPSIWFLTSLNFLYTPKTTIAPTYLSITLNKKIRQRQNKNQKKCRRKGLLCCVGTSQLCVDLSVYPHFMGR